MSAVARRLELAGGVFVGWSLGGDVLLQAARRLPEAAGLMIFGTAPLGVPHDAGGFVPGSAARLGVRAELSPEEIETYGRSFFRAGATEVPGFVFDDIRATDPRARALLAAGRWEDERAVLERLSCPVAVLHGLREQLVDLSFLERLQVPGLWRGAVQTVDRAGHAVQLERPGRFNELLEQFVDSVAG